MNPDRFELLGATRDATLAAVRARLPQGSHLASKIHRDAHRSGRFEPERFGVTTGDLARWHAAFALGGLDLAALRTGDGDDRTRKAVLRTHDALEVETVRIPMGAAGESQCVSSQVGCAMGCRFCETGLMGRLRDLSAAEIVAQVVIARHELGWNPRGIVFQGMGEPLDAFEPVAAAIRALCDPNGLSFARDKLTVCTAGHVDGIRRLAALGLGRLNLSVSLNVADESRRAELMPIARRWPLPELQAALVDVRPRRNWQLGIHVCLMPGINDARADAAAVAAFCRPLGRVMVHLIPYNPGSRPLTRAPAEAEIVRFVGWLRDHGVPVRRRITKGRALMAACGQLGNPALRAKRRGEPTGRGAGLPDQDSNLG